MGSFMLDICFQESSLVLLSSSILNFIPWKMMLIVSHVFYSWAFFNMRKVSSLYQIHTLSCLYGRAIDSRHCIIACVMSPESSDPKGVPLICWYICLSD